MPQTSTQPTFLPLTIAAVRAAADGGGRLDAAGEPPVRAAANAVWQRATEADAAAAECWIAMLAACDSPGSRLLPSRLQALTDATAGYAGTAWWHSEGSYLRRRVAEAQHGLVEAVRDRDGQEFAEAFIGYDQAVASTVVAVQSRLGSPA